MSYPRPNQRRRGLPLLTPLLIVGVLAAGAALSPTWLAAWNARHTNNLTPAAKPSDALAAPGPAPSSPPGILFDSFHYSGHDDPALTAHGWQAREGEGGPGIQDTWSAAGVSFPSMAGAQ